MSRRVVPPDEYPWWVQLSLWGVPYGRTGQWFFVAFALACAVGLVAYGVVEGRPRFLILSPFAAVAALPYWLSIRWIDRHGSWQGSRVPDEDGD